MLNPGGSITTSHSEYRQQHLQSSQTFIELKTIHSTRPQAIRVISWENVAVQSTSCITKLLTKHVDRIAICSLLPKLCHGLTPFGKDAV